MTADSPAIAHPERVGFSGRREVLYIALAAAEVCWAAPLFLAFGRTAGRHPPLLLGLALLVLLLGFFYFYRALMRANLALGIQQAMLVLALLVGIGLVLRYHVYADSGLQGFDWLLEPFRRFADLSATFANELLAIFTLLYFWARGIHLARRSVSAEAVGFSFRSGVVIFIWVAVVVALFVNGDASSFIAPYFFFGLVSVALARIEEVSQLPGSRQAPNSSFWVGSMVVATALVVLLSSLVAVFFYGGSLEQILRFLSPLLIFLEVLFVVLVMLLFALFELLLSVLPFDWAWLGELMREIMEGISLARPEFPEDAANASVSSVLGTVQAGVIVGTFVALVALVLLFTWWRVRRGRYGQIGESRESLLSADILAQGLMNMLRSGRDRLSQMAGLVDRFGLGQRLLTAISIQRIYVNLLRLATRAGYPRSSAQTPYEYLEVLHQAWPDLKDDVTIITEAYVNAHYGMVPDTREELARIRASWDRVRTGNLADQ